MRVFAGGIATETNTFCSFPTTLDDFVVRRDAAAPGAGVTAGFDLWDMWGSHVERDGGLFILGPMAYAQPSGITARPAYEALRDELMGRLRAALPLDVILLMLHGAMVAEGYDDCEQDIIEHVRAIVGSGVFIGVELDLHCHLTDQKLANADVVVTYKEYPHTDINERALEVYRLARRWLAGEIRPTMALFDCRMIGVYPTKAMPLREFVESMRTAESNPEILSISFGHGFQYADLPHVGAKLLVVTNADLSLARKVAREFGLAVHARRREIGLDRVSLSLDQALSAAMAGTRTPVVVADQSDNPGGGAPGDATFALRWLLDKHARDVAMGIFYDPEVVRIAKRSGPGARLSVRVGGKTSRLSGDPVDLMVTVLSVRHDYVHSFAQASGPAVEFNLGDVAGLRADGIDLVVSSARCQCYSPDIFSDLGINPTAKRILIPKSTQHFHAAFAQIAGEIIYMSGPGAVPPDPRRVSYSRLDTRNMYPWNPAPDL